MVSADGGLPPCAIEINQAAGGGLSEDEIIEIATQIQRRRMRLEAEGKIDNIDQRMAEIAREEGDKARLAAALARKQTALTIIARDRAENQIAGLRAAGLTPKAAVLAILEGTVKGAATARKSIYATKLAFESRFIGQMMANVLKEAPETLRLLKDKDFGEDVLREMYQIKEDGTPSISGNPDAAKVAKIFATHAEVARTDLNRLGANIGKLDGWAPQAHDAAKLLSTTPEDWAREIMPRLDLQRSFPDMAPAKIEAALKDVYKTIVTGKDNSLTAKRQGKVTGPANLAKRLGKERVLHFKSADDWLTYNERFGVGNVVTSILNHQRRSASIAAQMQTLGPNPELMLNSLLDKMQTEVRNDPKLNEKQRAKQVKSLTTEGSQIGQALAEARGLTLGFNPDGLTTARVNGGIRALQSMAKLGFALASSTGDFVTQAANMKYHGKPLFESYGRQAIDMVHSVGRTGGDMAEKEIAYTLGEGFDGLIDHIHSSTFANDGVPGFLTDRMANFFKWSGLTWWTDSMRAAGARMIAANMGLHSGKGWGKLGDQFKFVLEQHGIDAARWDIIRQAAFKAENGKTYITPDRIGELPDEAFSSLIDGEPTKSKVARAKLDTELALRRFISDELNFGMIETDARSRRFTLRGTQGGTFYGELLRHLFQFKGWPVSFTNRVLGRAITGQRNGLMSAQSIGHIGHLIAGLTIAGYAAQTLKDYARGYDRRKLQDPDGSVNWATIGSAMAQGGAAGIYGDFLFAQANRFGSGPLETAVGPAIGTGSDIIDLMLKARDGDATAADGLNLVLQNTPYANLHLVRPTLDWLILNSIREGLSPGFLDRQAESRRRDYGQGLWHRQTLQ
jgi:hypothetical protein